MKYCILFVFATFSCFALELNFSLQLQEKPEPVILHTRNGTTVTLAGAKLFYKDENGDTGPTFDGYFVEVINTNYPIIVDTLKGPVLSVRLAVKGSVNDIVMCFEPYKPTNTKSVPTKNDLALGQLLGGETDTRKKGVHALNLLRTVDALEQGATGYAYDSRDRLQSKAVAWNSGPAITLNYAYDANGNLTNLWSSTSGGVTNVYQYDSLNRLTNVIDNGLNGTKNTSYTFDGVGNMQTLRYPNGVTNLWQYDPLNRLTNLTWKVTTTTLGTFSYQLGPTGNRTKLVETVGTSPATSRTNQWQYDSLYRLTNEIITTATSGTLGYGYDAVGNRTNRTVTGLSLTNQSPTFNTNDWLNTDGYDRDGNTTASAGVTYGYDVVDRIIAVTNGSTVITIEYDGDGNRVRKTISGVATYYLLDDRNPTGYAQVVEEWVVGSGSANLSRVYAHGLDLISQRVIGGATSYYGFDGHGSTRFLTSTRGTITDTYAYDAYGTLIASTVSTANNYLYSGEQYDSDLGFYYLRARYFNPQTGRFWTADIGLR